MKRWRIEKTNLDLLKPSAQNARKIDESAYNGLMRSIARFGYVEPIIWNERSSQIVGGHQRFKILTSKGIEEAVIVIVNFSEEEELAANITLNNPEIEGEFDDPAEQLLDQIEESDVALYGALRLDKLRTALEEPVPNPGNSDGPDTLCPCCGHEWLLTDDDVESEEIV